MGQSSSSKKKFIPPRPPSDDEDEEEIKQESSNNEVSLPNGTSNPLADGLLDIGSSPDLFGIMDSIMGNSQDSSKTAKWKLDQLQTLESQLSKLKTTITAAKTQATKELENDKQEKVDLEKNLAFVQVKHQVSNIKIVQETQHDRL